MNSRRQLSTYTVFIVELHMTRKFIIPYDKLNASWFEKQKNARKEDFDFYEKKMFSFFLSLSLSYSLP